MRDIVKEAGAALSRLDSLKAVFLEVQQPRSEYALVNFVVGEHDLPERQYLQLVEEMRRAYQSVRLGIVRWKKLRLEREAFIGKSVTVERDMDRLEAEERQILMDDQEAHITGKLRELDVLFRMWSAMRHYTLEEIEKAEPEYWKRRLLRQAAEDVMASGKVGVGNIEALRQAGLIAPPSLILNREVSNVHHVDGVAEPELPQEVPA